MARVPLPVALHALKSSPAFHIPGVIDGRVRIHRDYAKAIYTACSTPPTRKKPLMMVLTIALDDGRAAGLDTVDLWDADRARILSHLASTNRPQEGQDP